MKKLTAFQTVVITLAMSWIVGVASGVLFGYAMQAKEPVPTAQTTRAATEAELLEPKEHLISLGEFKVTAYCPCAECCGKWADGYTSTGTKATEGRTIAVDTDVIPYGTTVIIDGNEYIAEDCGYVIKGKCIDIYFDEHKQAVEFGVKYKEVIIKVEG
mgnify:CR=1 FL=1